jgi:hypothetical protein
MHDIELRCHAQYDQVNDAPDDLYVVPMTHDPRSSSGAINNFPAFSRHLKMMRYPKEFKLTIEKYDGQSDPSIWLNMYSIVAQASGGNEDHMVEYSPLVMGLAPLLWLDNLLVECITSWATLSRLFMMNYQVAYNHPATLTTLPKCA